MERLLGQRLVKDGVITEPQLEEALERQRHRGGRIGANLVALGHMTAEDLEALFKRHKVQPRTIEETGLEASFIADLMLKHILLVRSFNLVQLSQRLKLPVLILDEVVQLLRGERLVEVKGAPGFMRETYDFTMTGLGRKRGGELMELNRYVGPAPVTLEDYSVMVELQTVKNIAVEREHLKRAFSHLVINESLLNHLGLAANAGKASFLYGPPGNGKTTIAETLGKVLPGSVYIPYAVLVEGQVITVFDQVSHIPTAEETAQSADQRWVAVKRPVIITGGELSLKMLDLQFNPVARFFEAPLQMKANNGLFIVDDFGRQQIPPEDLLNRWIVPLERRLDFLSLHTGMKFPVPFDQLTIFATNIEPARLVDEAFLRRIRYKIKIDHPTVKEYEAIFRRVCEANGISFDDDVFECLMRDFYEKLGVKLNACHPRDLVDHIIDSAHYFNVPPRLTKEGIAEAWESYIVPI